jgi:5-formyltetrahydrofolate cyclo-ligase
MGLVADVTELKRALRSHHRAQRRSILAARDRADVADALARHAVALARRIAPDGGQVSAYESFDWEPPTDALLPALAEAGYDVLVPVTLGGARLDWRAPGAPGTCEDRRGADALGSCVLVLTPGLAVDRSGMRLGQGGAYYDVALAQVAAGTPVVTVVYDEEFVDAALPAQRHDRRVDGVLTPCGVTWITGSRWA